MLTCNKENMQKVVAGLRSGGFMQGCSVLSGFKKGVCYHCALGVICEIAIDNGVIIDKRSYQLYAPSRFDSVFLYDNTSAHLPAAITEWLGTDVSRDIAIIDIDGKQTRVSYLNDELKLTFSEIADKIEESYDLKD